MKVTTLDLKNLGVWREARVEFDRPVSIIFAENGFGKTTLTTALELVIRGKAARFEGHRLGLASLIGPAGELAAVMADLEATGKPIVIGRRLTTRGLVTEINHKETSKEVFDFFSPKEMRDPARAWRAVATVGGVLDAEDKDAKALLLDLVDPAVPASAVKDLPWDALGTGAPETIDQVASFYDLAFQKRRNAKATHAGLRVTPAPATPEQDLAAIEKKLEELQATERTLLAARGKDAGKREELQARHARLVDEADQAKVTAKEMAETEPDLVKSIQAAQESIEATRAARAAHASEDKAIAVLETNLETLRGQARALTTLGKACVISADLECPLKPAQRQKQDEEWKRRIDQSKAEITTRRSKLQLVPDPSVFVKEIEGYTRQLALIAQAAKTATTLQAELDEVTRRLAALPEEIPDADDTQAIRTRIERGQSNLAEARRVNLAWAEHRKSAEAERKGALAVQALERLCEALGPKGIGERLLAERLGAVEGRLNEVLKRFGLAVTFTSEPFAIRFNGRPPLLLSGSERFRAGVAFQVAVAAVTGARWCCIDGLDVLDRGNRTALMNVLTQAVQEGHIDQAIVTATYVNPAALAPLAAPLRAYHISEPGVIRRLE